MGYYLRGSLVSLREKRLHKNLRTLFMYSRSEVKTMPAHTENAFFSSSFRDNPIKKSISSIKRLVLMKLLAQFNVKPHFLALTCYHQKPHEPKPSSRLVSSSNFWFRQPFPPDSWKDSGVFCSYICSFSASISIKQVLLTSKLDQLSSVLLFSLCLACFHNRFQNLCRAPLMSRGCNCGFGAVLCPTKTSICSSVCRTCLVAVSELYSI